MTTPSKTPFATRRFVPWAASPFLVLFRLAKYLDVKTASL